MYTTEPTQDAPCEAVSNDNQTKGDDNMTNTHEGIDVSTNADAPKITDVTAQAIRRTYLKHRKIGDEGSEISDVFTTYSGGRADGVVETLNLLGIEIEKVNAEVNGS